MSNDNKTREIGAPEALVKFSEEFKRQIITVLPGIHCAIGYGLANCMLIEGDHGNIIIDTLESRESARQVFEDFKKISTEKIVAIIYTHNHGDHVFGTDVFMENNKENIKIYSHSKTREILDTTLGLVQQITFQRAARQFGIYLNDETGAINDGIGLKLNLDKDGKRGLVYPTDTFEGKSETLNICGRELILYHAPGETDDQIVIFMPKEKVLFAADNIYKSFPNLYAIRGTTTRDAVQWVRSLDLMRNLRPHYLIPSHTKPFEGEEKIYEILTIYRDGIQFVHDQTVRFMNKGFTPDEMIGNKFIELPKHLKEHPFLQEFYGTVDWSIRGIFDRYMGWFSGKSSDLNVDSPFVRAQNLIKLGGGFDNVFQSAENAFQEEKYQWCLELTEALLLHSNEQTKPKIVKLQVATLQTLASFQTSANGRNWFLTKSLEIQNLIEIKPSANQRSETIRNASLENLFSLLTVNLDYRKVDQIHRIVLFNFREKNEKFSIEIRNGIVDVQCQWPEDLKKFEEKLIFIEIEKESVWKDLISRTRNPMAILSNDEILIKDLNGETTEQVVLGFLQFLTFFVSDEN